MSTYRVLAGRNPHSVKVYEGDDLHAAVQAFYDSWPKDMGCNFRCAEHLLTHEPLVEMRRADDDTMAAALYGVSGAQWADISKFWGMLPPGVDEWDDDVDRRNLQ